MSHRAFALEPYPGLPAPSAVRVSGTAWRDGATLELTWQLEGPEASFSVPATAENPKRTGDLWEQTCFEVFLAVPDRPGYREFNLSPAGHWNVFRFASYRSGPEEEEAFAALPFSVSSQLGVCSVSARIDTTRLGCGMDPWLLAIATVVAEPEGRLSYWALSHPGQQPDFHHAGAFVLHLAPSE